MTKELQPKAFIRITGDREALAFSSERIKTTPAPPRRQLLEERSRFRRGLDPVNGLCAGLIYETTWTAAQARINRSKSVRVHFDLASAKMYGAPVKGFLDTY